MGWFNKQVVNGEHFIVSQWRPRVLYSITLIFIRLLVWGPYPFVSLTIGLPSKGLKAKGGKAYAAQAYLGIKCDATKSHEYGGYWMRTDLHECWAARIHPVAVMPEWSDQGGA